MSRIKPIKDVWKDFEQWLNTPEKIKQERRENLIRRVKELIKE